MPRYKLTIEYDGTPFSGWQVQDNAPTVQGALEGAVKAICGDDVRVHGAGRTDAGVHALGQVAHCDIAKSFAPGRLRDGLNAHRLLGKHDFSTFRDSECQAKSPEKTLDRLDVVREGDAVDIATSARSFLHSQVRSMVGSLVWVGEGRWGADDLAAALAARDRAACGPVAPPEGLYLVKVDY